MNFEAIVMGASAGGLHALQAILSQLPTNFQLPIMIVQHRPPVADDFLLLALANSCSLQIKEADQHDSVQSGEVYLAPANYHLLVERDRTLSLSIDAKVCLSRPSIDVLFDTAADTYQGNLIGIILTGANHDGTAGLKKIKARGGLTIAQDPTTAEVGIMPRSAIRANAVDKVLTLADIAAFLNHINDLNAP